MAAPTAAVSVADTKFTAWLFSASTPLTRVVQRVDEGAQQPPRRTQRHQPRRRRLSRRSSSRSSSSSSSSRSKHRRIKHRTAAVASHGARPNVRACACAYQRGSGGGGGAGGHRADEGAAGEGGRRAHDGDAAVGAARHAPPGRHQPRLPAAQHP
eukprot:scaffold1563_cov307-Prasinococcus_capsulatus_cf.AAC.2